MTIGRSQAPYRCFAKLFLTWSPTERLLRMGRLCWANGKPGQPGGGYSASLSMGLTPRLFRFQRGLLGEWALTLLGVRVHHKRSYGGYQGYQMDKLVLILLGIFLLLFGVFAVTNIEVLWGKGVMALGAGVVCLIRAFR